MPKPKLRGKPQIVTTGAKIELSWLRWGEIEDFADGSAKEIKAVGFLHYLNPYQRAHLANSIWRVLEIDGKANIQVPHWLASKYYDDNVQWPPVTEQWRWWLNKFWRDQNGHNVGAGSTYECNFHVVPVYNLHPLLSTRPQQFNEFAVQFYKEAAQDLIFNLTKYPLDKEP